MNSIEKGRRSIFAAVSTLAVAACGSSSGSTGSTGTNDPYAAARQQCLTIINADRASLTPPSPPLILANATNQSCVDQQAKGDSEANQAHANFGHCGEYAQDECPGWPGPPSDINTNCLASMWKEGPPPPGMDNHWLNMSAASYKQVACGFYLTPKGDYWATQDFW